MKGIPEQLVVEIAREVIARLEARVGPLVAGKPSGGDSGVFGSVDAAVNAAKEAQQKVAAQGLDDRARHCGIVRRLCNENAPESVRVEVEGTKLGRVDYKI